MNRRGFLASLATLAAGAIAAEFDPERLLWVPGAKTFFLPSVAPVNVPIAWDHASGISMCMVRNYDRIHDKDVCRLDVLYGVGRIEDYVTEAARSLADHIDANTVAFHKDAFRMVMDPLT